MNQEDAVCPMCGSQKKEVRKKVEFDGDMETCSHPWHDSVPSETAAILLHRENGQISAQVKIPGAIVEATALPMKEALRMLTDALSENDEPFWRSE